MPEADLSRRCSVVFRRLDLVLLLLLPACDSTKPKVPSAESLVELLEITVNPSGYVPLAAELRLTTTRPVQVEILVPGRYGTSGAVVHRFKEFSDTHVLPVLGLYASTDNRVLIRFYDASGDSYGEFTRTITAQPLIPGLPSVTVEVNQPGHKPGFNLVSYFGATGEFLPMTPLFIDPEGAVRWYADFEDHPVLNNLFFDVGVERLANGNLFFGDGSSGRIVEIDMLGYVVNEWLIPGYSFHHHVLEMVPDGNLLATVNKNGEATIEDHVIEIDRTTGAIVQEWDLRASLDKSRLVWTDDKRDWFHGNGLAYDAENDAIIVSGRVQGTVKLTRNNEVVWILAPHRGWHTSGDGANLATKLLQPLDVTGSPIGIPDVREGTQSHPDFDWAWYQHAPKILPNGDLMLFDNGPNRHYGSSDNYSRAVVYRIDEQNMTIRQVWEYGKERGWTAFAPIVSDVDYHLTEDNIVFSPGAIWTAEGNVGRIIEVDVESRQVRYEATLQAQQGQFGIVFHRVERLPLYPPEL